MSSLHLRIVGRVQGVGFREAMRSVANRLNINGWVRNRADGSVEAVIAGSESAIAMMLDWCRDGPPLARVDSVEQHATDGDFSGFSIRATE